MPFTNVELSKNESELVTDKDFILTKNRIIEKIYRLYGAISEEYKTILNNHAEILPAEVFASTPKIYKGENYLGLPYVMLDYPRIFFKEDAFAIRSFFWWGNYFSITLQLAGSFLQTFRNNIEAGLKNEADVNYFICVNNIQWEHHFEESNYKLLSAIDSLDNLLNKPFIKIAKKHSLTEYKSSAEFYTINYQKFLQLLVTQTVK